MEQSLWCWNLNVFVDFFYMRVYPSVQTFSCTKNDRATSSNPREGRKKNMIQRKNGWICSSHMSRVMDCFRKWKQSVRWGWWQYGTMRQISQRRQYRQLVSRIMAACCSCLFHWTQWRGRKWWHWCRSGNSYGWTPTVAGSGTVTAWMWAARRSNGWEETRIECFSWRAVRHWRRYGGWGMHIMSIVMTRLSMPV